MLRSSAGRERSGDEFGDDELGGDDILNCLKVCATSRYEIFVVIFDVETKPARLTDRMKSLNFMLFLPILSILWRYQRV